MLKFAIVVLPAALAQFMVTILAVVLHPPTAVAMSPAALRRRLSLAVTSPITTPIAGGLGRAIRWP